MDKKRLGKGLGALITNNNEDSGSGNKVVEIFIDNIEPNPFQPREDFGEEALRELADSIKEKGLLQPISVRKIEPERYQLVAGERRWRASRMAGITKIPAIINDYTDKEMMEIALIENLQREDLNPIEEAQAYRKMIDNFNMTQEEVSREVGKSRSSVANMVRLLNLSPKVQVYVSRETLSVGHARALLAIKDSNLQIKAAEHIINNDLSVRETEKYISNLKNDSQKSDNMSNKKKKSTGLSQKWIEAGNMLSNHLGRKVKVRSKRNKKVISIECEEFSDVERLLKMINT